LSGCEAFVDWTEDLGQCGDLDTATVITACPHEHVREGRVCAGCAAELQRNDPSWLTCSHCEESAQPHRCQAHITIRWDSGDITRTEGSGWVTDRAGAIRC
jgi:hypothetical protein